jgi:hypothetical protein
MAKAMQELKIVVQRKSAFGVLFNDTWYNLSKYGSASIGDFEVGQAYNIKYTVSPKGGAYIEEAVKVGETGPVPTPRTTAPTLPAPMVDADPTSAPLSQRDMLMAAMASMKSVFESPLISALAATTEEDKIPGLIEKYFKLGVSLVVDSVK